jgi:hypothetical protein
LPKYPIVFCILQLSPSDSDIIERHKREQLEARQYARKLNTVILSDKANEKEKEKEDKDNKLEQVGLLLLNLAGMPVITHRSCPDHCLASFSLTYVYNGCLKQYSFHFA